jgi:hypothetical protein
MEMAIPEEVQKLPPEQQAQWLNRQFQQAAELQKKVAQERFAAREHTRAEIIQTMNAAAAERERQIAEARDALQERQDKADQEQATASGLLGVMLVACLAALLYNRWRAASEPVGYY